MSADLVAYTRRREQELSDVARRRQWDEADDDTRAAMVDQAKANYMTLLDHLTQ